jgi:hypothetical protein
MKMSKLYTEEAFNKYFETRCVIWEEELKAFPELKFPTSSEINKEAVEQSLCEEMQYRVYARLYFRIGAEWVLEQIKGGDNETK